MCYHKEIDMTRMYKMTLSAFGALFLTLGSIGAIVTVPPAQASATAVALDLPELA